MLSALAATSVLANAQTINKVRVHLPYTVTVGSTELAPGDYEILPTTGTMAGKYFEIYSDDRDRFAALVSVMPASKLSPASNTELILLDNGNGEFTLDQMWIEGATGGFEFSTPKSSAAGERQAKTVELNADPAR
jgi:hypothetical protein